MLASKCFHFLDNKRGMKLNALVRAEKLNEFLIFKEDCKLFSAQTQAITNRSFRPN